MPLINTVEQLWNDTAMPALMDSVRIPAKSTAFDSHWEQNGYLFQACQLAQKWIQSVFPQAHTEILSEKGRTPCLFLDIASTSNELGNKTVVFYGHLDKQPEAGGWSDGLAPWMPVIRNGKLYGRGCADDGYSLFSMAVAVRALEKEGLPHPRIVGLFETQEESGSLDLPHYLDKLQQKIGQPLAFIVLDNHCGDYERVWLSASLRGTICGTLEVQSMSFGVHSGTYSGMVPDPFGIAQALVARLHDPVTGVVKIDSCYTPIPEKKIAELQKAAQVLGNKVWNHAPLLTGVNTKLKDNAEILIQETWKPALTVIGISGLPDIANAGNVVPGKIALRLSMRIPPHIDVEKAARDIETALTTDVPFGCISSWSHVEALPGWASRKEDSFIERSFNTASLKYFGTEAAITGQGGSISIISEFEKFFPAAEMILTGVLGPESNAHAPDESLDLEYTKKLTAVVAEVISQIR